VDHVSERTSWAVNFGVLHMVAIRWQVLLNSPGRYNWRGFPQWPTQFANTHCQSWQGAQLVLSLVASQSGLSAIVAFRVVDCSHGISSPGSKELSRSYRAFPGFILEVTTSVPLWFSLRQLQDGTVLRPRAEKVWDHQSVKYPQDTSTQDTLVNVLAWLWVMSSILASSLYIPPWVTLEQSISMCVIHLLNLSWMK
jgi:hypothetical protein